MAKIGEKKWVWLSIWGMRMCMDMYMGSGMTKCVGVVVGMGMDESTGVNTTYEGKCSYLL